MKTINLKLYLLVLIFLVAGICLMSTVTVVLYQADKQSKQDITVSADAITKHLEVQLLFRTNQGANHYAQFPDFTLWNESDRSPGLCVNFQQQNQNYTKSACRGDKITELWPRWFETLYRWVFKPSEIVVRQIMHNKKAFGTVSLSPSVEMELNRAWVDVKKLMGLSVLTVMSLCTLLYFAVDWALRPARLIVSELEKMASGNLETRLPDFRITEWQQTGTSINSLAENLQHTLSERKALALKLVNTQEQERRFLVRELHDELGQSLAGLAALASLITQTAENKCPQLIQEGKNISRITAHMMSIVSGLLSRLRPVDFDELGFTDSLKAMIASWNVSSKGKTRYQLSIIGNFENISEPIPVNLFRIIQECLSNISKHAAANQAKVKLKRSICATSPPAMHTWENITLTIEDDGIAKNIDFSGCGIGLLGIKERVTALGGQLKLKKNKPSGLKIDISIPLQDLSVSST